MSVLSRERIEICIEKDGSMLLSVNGDYPLGIHSVSLERVGQNLPVLQVNLRRIETIPVGSTVADLEAAQATNKRMEELAKKLSEFSFIKVFIGSATYIPPAPVSTKEPSSDDS